MKGKGFIGQNQTFFTIIAGYLTLLSIFIAVFGYKDSFLILNGGGYSFIDLPMFIITHMGDALILTTILTMIFIWKQPHAVLNIIVVVVVTGLIGQLLKSMVFEGWDRPLRVFNESPIVHTLPSYRLFHNSFPSGHSITSMAAFTSLVISINPKYYYQIVISFLAILVTYSRVYLGVHFPGDVLAGSLIGITGASLIIPLTKGYINKVRIIHSIKIVIAVLAFVLLITGVWFIRIYFPLI